MHTCLQLKDRRGRGEDEEEQEEEEESSHLYNYTTTFIPSSLHQTQFQYLFYSVTSFAHIFHQLQYNPAWPWTSDPSVPQCQTIDQLFSADSESTFL